MFVAASLNIRVILIVPFPNIRVIFISSELYIRVIFFAPAKTAGIDEAGQAHTARVPAPLGYGGGSGPSRYALDLGTITGKLGFQFESSTPESAPSELPPSCPVLPPPRSAGWGTRRPGCGLRQRRGWAASRAVWTAGPGRRCGLGWRTRTWGCAPRPSRRCSASRDSETFVSGRPLQ